jgi:hypothetical protein
VGGVQRELVHEAGAALLVATPCISSGLRGAGYASARALGRGPAAAVERIRFG